MRPTEIAELVRWATFAPSSHNTQPWRFVAVGPVVEVWADRSRRLPVADPHDRELTISCGAALGHLEVAARHAGLSPAVETMPDSRRPDLLARVRFESGAPADSRTEAMFHAIPERHTNRRLFEDRPIRGRLLIRLTEQAYGYGAWLAPVPDAEREAVADLVAEAERRQFGDPVFRRELARWMRSDGGSRGVGMPGSAFGLGRLASRVAPWIVRAFDTGARTAAADRALALEAPELLVLGTYGDRLTDWICAGRALSRILLTLTAAGASASFLNAPIQVASCRERLARAIGREGWPQLLIRAGFAAPARPTPRLAPDAVLEFAP